MAQHNPSTIPLDGDLQGQLPNAGLSTQGILRAQIFGRRVTSAVIDDGSSAATPLAAQAFMKHVPVPIFPAMGLEDAQVVMVQRVFGQKAVASSVSSSSSTSGDDTQVVLPNRNFGQPAAPVALSPAMMDPTVQTLTGGGVFVRQGVPDNTILRVPTGYGMTVPGDFVIDGTLILDGTLVIL